MLKIRIIPTLLWKDYGLVKGIGFDSWRRVGSVLPSIKVYTAREVDELILVDITASRDNREPDYDSIKDFCFECSVPMCVGGGIRNLEQVRKLLRVGADKVSINSAAFDAPNLISQIALNFGTQCVVASIDVKKNIDGHYVCMSRSGTHLTAHNPVEWAKQMEERGAGEILLTSIDRDGTMQGYDLELIKAVSSAVSIPVIASGGAGDFEHMFEAITIGGSSAVAAASIFQFTEKTPLEAKVYLKKKGIQVRLDGLLKV